MTSKSRDPLIRDAGFVCFLIGIMLIIAAVAQAIWTFLPRMNGSFDPINMGIEGLILGFTGWFVFRGRTVNQQIRELGIRLFRGGAWLKR